MFCSVSTVTRTRSVSVEIRTVIFKHTANTAREPLDLQPNVFAQGQTGHGDQSCRVRVCVCVCVRACVRVCVCACV